MQSLVPSMLVMQAEFELTSSVVAADVVSMVTIVVVTVVVVVVTVVVVTVVVVVVTVVVVVSMVVVVAAVVVAGSELVIAAMVVVSSGGKLPPCIRHCSSGTHRVTFSGPCCKLQQTPGGRLLMQSLVPSMLVMQAEFELTSSAVAADVVSMVTVVVVTVAADVVSMVTVVVVTVVVVVVTVVAVVSMVVVVKVVVVAGSEVVTAAMVVVSSGGKLPPCIRHCSSGTHRVTFSGPCCKLQQTPGGRLLMQSLVPSMLVMQAEFELTSSVVAADVVSMVTVVVVTVVVVVVTVVVVVVTVVVVVVTVVVVVSMVVVVTVVVVAGSEVVTAAMAVVSSGGKLPPCIRHCSSGTHRVTFSGPCCKLQQTPGGRLLMQSLVPSMLVMQAEFELTSSVVAADVVSMVTIVVVTVVVVVVTVVVVTVAAVVVTVVVVVSMVVVTVVVVAGSEVVTAAMVVVSSGGKLPPCIRHCSSGTHRVTFSGPCCKLQQTPGGRLLMQSLVPSMLVMQAEFELTSSVVAADVVSMVIVVVVTVVVVVVTVVVVVVTVVVVVVTVVVVVSMVVVVTVVVVAGSEVVTAMVVVSSDGKLPPCIRHCSSGTHRVTFSGPCCKLQQTPGGRLLMQSLVPSMLVMQAEFELTSSVVAADVVFMVTIVVVTVVVVVVTVVVVVSTVVVVTVVVVAGSEVVTAAMVVVSSGGKLPPCIRHCSSGTHRVTFSGPCCKLQQTPGGRLLMQSLVPSMLVMQAEFELTSSVVAAEVVSVVVVIGVRNCASTVVSDLPLHVQPTQLHPYNDSRNWQV